MIRNERSPFRIVCTTYFRKGDFFMRKKGERRGKKLDKRGAMLTGLGVGAAIILCLCLASATMLSSGKIPEEEITLFAVAAMLVGVFFGAFTTAKASDLRHGFFTGVIFCSLRIIAGAFSDGRVFGKTTMITLIFMLVCGSAGALAGGRKTKRRRI